MSILPGIYASQITGHLSTNSYESIQTVTVGAGGASSITFSSIPATYKHLQIRTLVNNTSVSAQDVYTQFNSDAGSNYSFHGLYGSGSAVAAYGYATQTKISTGVNLAGPGTSAGSAFCVGVIDILDYSNTSKYKTLRSLNGFDTNAGTTSINNESIALASGLWQSTSAITSIYMYSSGGNFAQYSSFALYGIKG